MILSNELKQFILDHESDNVRDLALKSKRYSNIDIPFAFQQIAGRQIAKKKLPSWYSLTDILYPKHLSLEQCSSEHTAIYKASLVQGQTMVDLTGGMGVDFSFIAKDFELATYVEQQEELVELANYNFKALNLNQAKTINGDAVEYLKAMQKVDLIYIDPARRSEEGRKTVLIEDCTPNLLDIDDLLEEKAKITMIKLSPMLDISLALQSLKGISDVHIVSHNNECKELLFIKQKDYKEQPQIHCVNIQSDQTDIYTFTKESEKQAKLNIADELGQYLYEPNASILKGGAYKSLSDNFSVYKLHISSHLYTSNTLEDSFPGRKFIIEGISSLNKKEVKSYLKGIQKANITTRNFPLSVQELRKRTSLSDGGDLYIFATTLADDKKVLIYCRKA